MAEAEEWSARRRYEVEGGRRRLRGGQGADGIARSRMAKNKVRSRPDRGHFPTLAELERQANGLRGRRGWPGRGASISMRSQREIKERWTVTGSYCSPTALNAFSLLCIGKMAATLAVGSRRTLAKLANQNVSPLFQDPGEYEGAGPPRLSAHLMWQHWRDWVNTVLYSITVCTEGKQVCTNE
nr:hypothetical protein CFP56_32425 [Quercus suber]